MDDKNIDHGQYFEWGKTSVDYGKYRDIYPLNLYEKLRELGIGRKGQKILDLGTGTGVLPRAMSTKDINFIGIDNSKGQIEEAKRLAKIENKEIEFYHLGAEQIAFDTHTFDAIISVQSWHYFDRSSLLEKLQRMLKPNGKLVIVYMYWLPYVDDLVWASEHLILKYNPLWTGGKIKRIDLKPRDYLSNNFKEEELVTFDEHIPFSREGWLGRIRSSRGVGATLNEEELSNFDKEHWKLIRELRPDKFNIEHQLTIEVYGLS